MNYRITKQEYRYIINEKQTYRSWSLIKWYMETNEGVFYITAKMKWWAYVILILPLSLWMLCVHAWGDGLRNFTFQKPSMLVKVIRPCDEEYIRASMVDNKRWAR